MNDIPRVVVDLFLCSRVTIEAKCLSCDLSHPCVMGKFPVNGNCIGDFSEEIHAVFCMVQTLGKRKSRFDNVKSIKRLSP